MYLDLTTIKKHLNIDGSFTDDDLYLLDLETVAEDAIAKRLNVTLDNILEGGELPSSVIHAMLLLIGDLYAHRESEIMGASPSTIKAFDMLIDINKSYAE